MLEELDYEDEIPTVDNDGECDKTVEKPDVEAQQEKESDSDTGELLDDEEPNDLEEGEIKESAPTTKKNPDLVCRYFQRGACMFGSQCQFLHVSDKVYKLLDTGPPVIKNNWNGLPPQPFIPPPFFHNPLPPKPDIQNSWERGIQNAKQIMQKGTYKRNDEFDDYEEETDWDRGLAQAKALISNSSSKRKESVKKEKLNVESKSSRTKRRREPSPEKKVYGPEVPKSQYTSESNYKREIFDNVKKPKYDSKEKSNYHMNWVDPWRRSKSPKERKRSRSISQSLSPSPPRNRSRKRSGSSCSCSSSSSNFKRTIYGSPILNQSLKRSKSRSYSISPTTLRNKGTAHSHKRKKRFSFGKSTSRSFSRSPSYSRSRSSSHSSGGFLGRRGNWKRSTEKALSVKKPMIENGKKFLSPERPYRKKSPHSDDEGSSSDMTVSSLSCTSLSSISDASSLHNEQTDRRYRRSSPAPNNGFGSNQRRTDFSNTKQSYQKYPLKPRRPLDEHLPVEINKRVSPNRRVSPPNRRVSSPNRRVSSPNRRVSPPNRRVSPPNRRVSPPNRRVSPPNRRVSPPNRRVSPPNRRVLSTNRRVSPPNRRVSPPNRRVSPPNRRVSPHNRRVSPNKNGVGFQNRRSSFEGRVHERPTSTNTKGKSYPTDSVQTAPKKLNQTVDKPITKPPAKKVKKPVSTAELELLKYHNTAPPEVQVPVAPEKPIEVKPEPVSPPSPPPPLPVFNSLPEVSAIRPPLTKHKIALNLQPKTQKQIKSGGGDSVLQVCNNIENEGSSKRELLLQQLKAIEDAIARKKHTI